MGKSEAADFAEVQEMKGMYEFVQVVIGIALAVVVSGIWVCLWVPPL
jgi:hypothetical protein